MIKQIKPKRVLALVLVVAMLFAVAGLSGCNREPTLQERVDSAGLQVYAMQNDSNATVADTEAFLAELADLHSEIAELYGDSNAMLLTRLDGYMAQLRELRAMLLRAVRQFPSPMEEFTIGDFGEDFFENYTLIFVPFIWPSMVRGYVDFYTAYIEDGKINFLIEVRSLSGDAALTFYVFTVVFPNETLLTYTIGQSSIFQRYSRPNPLPSQWEPIENCREWLVEIHEKSIEHRVGLVLHANSWRLNFTPYDNIAIVTNIEQFNGILELNGW